MKGQWMKRELPAAWVVQRFIWKINETQPIISVKLVKQAVLASILSL